MWGLRFPLDPFIVEVLSLFRSSIAQIHPNGWRILLSFMSFCRFHCITPYARVLVSMYPLYGLSFILFHSQERKWSF